MSDSERTLTAKPATPAAAAQPSKQAERADSHPLLQSDSSSGAHSVSDTDCVETTPPVNQPAPKATPPPQRSTVVAQRPPPAKPAPTQRQKRDLDAFAQDGNDRPKCFPQPGRKQVQPAEKRICVTLKKPTPPTPLQPDAYAQRLDDLERRINAIGNKVGDAETERACLQNALADAHAGNRFLRRQVEEAYKQIDALQKEAKAYLERLTESQRREAYFSGRQSAAASTQPVVPVPAPPPAPIAFAPAPVPVPVHYPQQLVPVQFKPKRTRRSQGRNPAANQPAASCDTCPPGTSAQ